ncbi:MAG: hypothetical protein GKR94_15075 [Gammaproteobacteria bacterium]|nr:hypothetical protein [Gammaproteobacteria bacterium]
MNDILGFDDGKTWEDVKREFDETHVKRIHEVYEVFWPPYTDLFQLLPKPDNELRALYSGVVDPRVISFFATSVVPLFDQLLIQSPLRQSGMRSTRVQSYRVTTSTPDSNSEKHLPAPDPRALH